MGALSTRRSELTRQAARLFAEKGYHGTSIGDLAEAMGVQKGSLYHHIASKGDLLWDVARDGAAAFHAALDAIDDGSGRSRSCVLALRAHLRVVAEQLDIATVFVREWRYLEGERAKSSSPSAAATRSAIRDALPRGRRAERAAHGPRRQRGGAALPLGGELGLHLAPAGSRHRRPRGPLLRPAR